MERTHRGFTLIELLVVIAILAILMGLILPAIQKVREAANRVRCAHNMKQLGTAVHNYHTSSEAFPYGSTVVKRDDGSRAISSWIAAILPLIEQDNLQRKGLRFTRDESEIEEFAGGMMAVVRPVERVVEEGNAAHTFSLINCASDSRRLIGWRNDHEWGCTSYLGVLGTDIFVRDGLFVFPPVAVAEITDGASNTLAVGERPPTLDLSTGYWHDSLFHSIMGTRNTCQRQHVSNGKGPDTGFYTGNPDDNSCVQIEVETYPDAYLCYDKSPHMFRPGSLQDYCSANHYWSLHPGGGNWLFGDGSVRFLAYEVSAITPALSTIAGGEIIPKGFEY